MVYDTVTNSSDDADTVGSLRYELAHANYGDTINFAAGITSVTLGSTLTIAQTVTIEGAGASSGVAIVGGGTAGGFSDFTIVKGVAATFDHLAISGGAFQGQDATLAATSPTQGGSGGGAANVFGELALMNTTISDNSAVGGAGSDAQQTSNFYKGGGAGGTAVGGIYVGLGGRLDLYGRSVTFARNEATGGHGGMGGLSTYAYGGAGGAGAHAVTRYAHGPSVFRRGAHGARGETSPLAEGRSGAGAGGRGGMAGQNGRTYKVSSYYAPYVGIGSGGGGGGGNAFSDFGGQGVVAHFRANPRPAGAVASRATTHAASTHAATSPSTLAAADPAPVCFAAGTLIRTARGDVRVEALAAGDLVVTGSGAQRPVRWLGHRTIDCGRHPRPNEVLPVRIAAHAFGEGRPERDLLVSPGHAICVDVGGEVLIPALALANGTTVTRAVVDTIAYWHVELDSHDIILAEGLPTESYLEMGNRAFFAESAITQARDVSPDGDASRPQSHADFCRPFESAGPVVDAVRRQLAVAAARRHCRRDGHRKVG